MVDKELCAADEEVIRRLQARLGIPIHRRVPSGVTRAGWIEVGRDGVVAEIYLGRCGLTEVPAELESLTAPVLLSLNHNKITLIPDWFSRRPSLRTIDLRFNQIHWVPSWVAEWALGTMVNTPARRAEVNLVGNPLTRPPAEVVERGWEAVASWWAASTNAPRRKLNEVRILCVGDGAVGKTSLIKALRGESYDPHESQTHGIRIQQWTTSCKGETVMANLWDFGGQEVMHATHQFFLSRRSLYVVVLDCRRDDRTEYWLQHADSFGRGSPVIVVINKIDENPGFDANRRFLKEKYPFIRDFYRVSCSTGEGIDPLRNAVAQTIEYVEVHSTEWPWSWFQVKAALEADRANYIDSDRFERLCCEHGIDDPRDQQTLIDFLHDLGVVLHFPDLGLQDLHVLQPQWVTDAVYRIINAPALAAGGGRLGTDLVRTILAKQQPAQAFYSSREHRYILEIMKRFSLCYDLDASRFVLVPALLPVQEPVLDVDLSGALHLQVQYVFLPPSIMPRLIVRLHRDIRQGFAWRSGMVLVNDRFATRAVVRGDAEARRIDIWVAGLRRREHLAVIRHALHELHDSFEKLEVTERIPCRCKVCASLDRPHFFDWEELHRRRDHGRRTVECSKSIAVLPIDELLWGVRVAPPKERRRWQVFLSYSRADFAIVQEIAVELQHAGVSYWWDEEQVTGGDLIARSVSEGLDRCETVIACLSRRQIGSFWSSAEIGAALSDALSRGTKKVIPLLIDDLSEQEIPSLFRGVLCVRRADARSYSKLLAELRAPGAVSPG